MVESERPFLVSLGLFMVSSFLFMQYGFFALQGDPVFTSSLDGSFYKEIYMSTDISMETDELKKRLRETTRRLKEQGLKSRKRAINLKLLY